MPGPGAPIQNRKSKIQNRRVREGRKGARMNGAAGTVRGGGRRGLGRVAAPGLPAAALVLLFLLSAGGGGGCARGPRMLKPAERKTIDRGKVEYPAGFDL